MLNLSELETDLRRAQCEMAGIDEEIEQQRRVAEDGFFRAYAETMLTSFEERKEAIVADRDRIAKKLAAA